MRNTTITIPQQKLN